MKYLIISMGNGMGILGPKKRACMWEMYKVQWHVCITVETCTLFWSHRPVLDCSVQYTEDENRFVFVSLCWTHATLENLSILQMRSVLMRRCSKLTLLTLLLCFPPLPDVKTHVIVLLISSYWWPCTIPSVFSLSTSLRHLNSFALSQIPELLLS